MPKDYVEGDLKVLFRIPFTWYWLAILTVCDGKATEFCLASKRWDTKGGFYYFYPLT